MVCDGPLDDYTILKWSSIPGNDALGSTIITNMIHFRTNINFITKNWIITETRSLYTLVSNM